MPWRNDATPRNTMKSGNVKTSELTGMSGILHGDHKGGNSDVADAKTKLASYGITPGKPNPNKMLGK